MQGNVTEIIGIAASIVVLAGFSVAIINGDKLAKVITAGGNAFTGSLKAATHPGK
jgi:hypothetical protein